MKQNKTGKIVSKFIIICLIVGLNWLGFLAVIQADAFFNDSESTETSTFFTAFLDFSLESDNDFSPQIIPNVNSEREIRVINNGGMDFHYDISIDFVGGINGLCQVLDIETWRDDILLSSSSLVNFNLNNLYLATSTFDDLSFVMSLNSNDYGYWSEICEFNFIFDGEQIGKKGFSDTETINNTIMSGTWSNLADYLVINKVYYDVDDEHGTEGKNEWIELYNPTDDDIVLKNWEICDKDDCARINANVKIASSGYAVLSHGANTWKYWAIPEDVEKINQLGGSPFYLDNIADMLMLKDPDGVVVDQLNWGEPDFSWNNASTTLWDPGAFDVPEGHMLGRVPSGYDTDQPSDFKDLSLPKVELTYPLGGEIWYVGRTYDITWHASNTNSGLDEDLDIRLYYSRNSGNTWGVIATSTENDGSYIWRVPLFLENGAYYVPSPNARIKVVATGPENFMVETWDMSEDFCPPIDFGLITDEERETLRMLGILPNNKSSVSDGEADNTESLLDDSGDMGADDAIVIDEDDDGVDGIEEKSADEPMEELSSEDLDESENMPEESLDEQFEKDIDNSESLLPAEDQENIKEDNQAGADEENIDFEPEIKASEPELKLEATEPVLNDIGNDKEDEKDESLIVEEINKTIPEELDSIEKLSENNMEEN